MKNLNFDFQKINEEDRRFLLNRNMLNLISNEQGRSGNVSLVISAIAILAAMFSIVIQTGNLIYYLIYAIFVIASIIMMIKKYDAVNRVIAEENNLLRKEFNKLFSLHFGYAQSSK